MLLVGRASHAVLYKPRAGVDVFLRCSRVLFGASKPRNIRTSIVSLRERYPWWRGLILQQICRLAKVFASAGKCVGVEKDRRVEPDESSAVAV